MDFACSFKRSTSFRASEGTSYRILDPLCHRFRCKNFGYNVFDSKIGLKTRSLNKTRKSLVYSGCLSSNLVFRGKFDSHLCCAYSSTSFYGLRDVLKVRGVRSRRQGNNSLAYAVGNGEYVEFVENNDENSSGTVSNGLGEEERNESNEVETPTVDELRELLQKAMRKLEVARLNSRMFEEKAQRISEAAIALKDKAAHARIDVNRRLDMIPDILNEERVAKEAVLEATMELSLAKARHQVAIESQKEGNDFPERSGESDVEIDVREDNGPLLAAQDEVIKCKETLENCEAELSHLRSKKYELHNEAHRLNEVAEKAEMDAFKAEEDVAHIMLLAEQAVAFELDQGPVKDSSMYMKGTLSSSLGSLPFLQVLVISGMKLITGPIPDSFSKLTRLTQLVLEDNSLRGNIPSGLGLLSHLQTLSLAGNHLKGPVPPSLGNLRNLGMINLGRNSLSGPIPASLKNLHLLQSFDLSFNSLSGFIPEFIGQFRNITFIDLSNNQLSAHLPISMFNLVSLSYLSLSHNQLTGTIPEQVGNLKSLTSLSLSSNKFIGHIPASISRLQNLWSLNLSRNGFSDPLPDVSNRGIPSLLSIDLSFNNLSLGTVPKWITDRQLSDVNLAGCKLRGSLPRFTRPDSLSSIDLSNNFLTGSISTFFTKMTSLQKVKLSNNLLKFDLSELKVPDGISSIDLHSNQVCGSLSSILNNRTSSFLEVIDVSNNLISGTIPEFSEGLNLKELNIGSNKIAGQIPSSISNLIELERLDVSRNLITGTIPMSLGRLANLHWLDLSINRLTGRIPTSLLGIKFMRHASFRANRLCGEIPQGRPYNIFPASAYAHNLCLCGKPMLPCRGKKQETSQ